MHTLKLLFTYYDVLIFIWIILFIVQTNFLLSFIFIGIINRLFFHSVIIILESNNIGDEGAKALAEGLKLNKNLAHLNLCIFMLLFT